MCRAYLQVTSANNECTIQPLERDVQMFTILRSDQRLHVQQGKQEVWHSFFKKSTGPFVGGFGLLVAFDELRIPPGVSTEPHINDEAEVVTYVFRGALSQEDTSGSSNVLHAGEFQRLSTGRFIRHKETSVSRSDWGHIFRISLRPAVVGVSRDHEQKRFTAAQRRNLMCIVASPDGRKGSLRIHQDALVFSAIFESGHHLIHPLETARNAWLHILCGEVTLNDTVLTPGDGVGVTDEPSVSLTVQEYSEMLLVDFGPVYEPPWSSKSS